MLYKFLFDKSGKYLDVNGRMDMVALYGPILNRHSVDTCFCKECSYFAKSYIKSQIPNNFLDSRKDSTITKDNLDENIMITQYQNKAPIFNNFFRIATKRIIDEDGIVSIWNSLCKKCKHSLENHVHLISGKEQSHLLNDNEITNMIAAENKTDLLKVLKTEKGNGAKLMIDYLEIKEPREFMYNKTHIATLFNKLDSDYFGRYNFQQIQNVILEDRRIRMNNWAAKILDISPLRVHKNRLLNPASLAKSLNDCKIPNDPNSVSYSENRMYPLTAPKRSSKFRSASTDFDPSYKKTSQKFSKNMEYHVQNKLLMRHYHKINDIDHINKSDDARGMILMLKNYNEGKDANWAKHAPLKLGEKPNSIFQTKTYKKNKLQDQIVRFKNGFQDPKKMPSVGNSFDQDNNIFKPYFIKKFTIPKK